MHADLSPARRAWNRFFTAAVWAAAILVMVLVAGIIGMVLVRGIPHISWKFLTTTASVLKGTDGILPAILNTLYVILLTLLIVLPLLTVYVWTSGLAGVLLTDALQGFVILAANLVMVGAVLWAFGGPSGLAEAVMSAAGPETGGAILSILPQAGNPVLSPLSIFAWMLIVSVGAGSAVGADGQRLFSCRSNREAAKVGIWGEVILFAMLLMLMLPAMGLLARHPEFYTASPSEREFAYGKMLSEFLPRGGVGLTVAALLAAVMSTISTHLTRFITGRSYNRLKTYMKCILRKLPLGVHIIHFIRRVEELTKNLLVSSVFFEEMGFKYVEKDVKYEMLYVGKKLSSKVYDELMVAYAGPVYHKFRDYKADELID